VGEDLKGSTHFWLLLLYFSTNMEDYLWYSVFTQVCWRRAHHLWKVS
jgi:hypothetical protein